MKSKILLLVFLFFVRVLCVRAQDATPTISAVKIVGNKRIATETYLYYITSKVGNPYDEETARADFKRLWQTGFLEDLKIETENTPQGVELVFKVVERPLLKSVEYAGNKKVSTSDIETKLKDENITIKTDQPFDPYIAKKASVAIDKLLLEKGLQFGSTSYKTEAVGDSYTKLTFVVDEGPKVRIGDIEFDGNKVFSDKKLRKTMKETREHWMFSWITRHDDFEKEKFEKDLGRIQELYFNHGYVNAKTDEPKTELYNDSGGTFGKTKKRMRITIPIQEGNQYKTGNITFSGNKVYSAKQLTPLIDLKKGKVFNRSMLKDGLETIQNKYGEKGYIYTSLSPVFNPNESTKTIDVNVEVEENQEIFVHRIEFTGNSFTRDKVIRRELLLQEGDLLRVNKFKESLDRIYRLGFFDDIKPNITPLADQKNQADVSIEVKENKRNEIRLGGGYSQLEGFFGNVVFSTKNLFGSGNVFSISLQGGSRSENYSLSLLDPYFLDRRISLGFSLFKSRYDYISYIQQNTGGSVTFGFPVYRDFKGAVTYSYQIVKVELGTTTNTGVVNPINEQLFPGFAEFLTNRTESRIVPQLVRSTINNPLDPTRGSRLVFSNEFTGGFLGGDLDYYKPSASFTKYLASPLSKRQFFAFNVENGYGFGMNGKPLPFIERYFLGGEQSIRGYDVRIVAPIQTVTTSTLGSPICTFCALTDDFLRGFNLPLVNSPVVVGGNKYFVFNGEYVIPIAGPLKLAGFLDYGNAFTEGQNIDFTDMRGSTGLEIRFLAPFLSAPFRFIYAINFNRGDLMTLPESVRPKRTVFRFSVGTTF
ncbi:MAG: outer membrane protein assembly factor BamA [Acidobacteria bacterium]|nr:MAG: outer membrane protein assembly factor BamA [Acidobacteriota bacterium]